jgi:hypothetical protein
MLLGLIVILIISWIFISIFLYPLFSFIRRYPRFSLFVLSLALITYWYIRHFQYLSRHIVPWSVL